MFNNLFGKKDEPKPDETEHKLGQTIQNLSDQVGGLQQDLNQRNKQIEDLMGKLTDAQTKAASGDATHVADAANTESMLKDAQAQMRALEARIGDLAKSEADAKAALAASQAAPVAATLGSAASMAGGAAAAYAAGSTMYVQRAGGANLRRRGGPSLDSVVHDSFTPGTALTLIDGPVQADGHAWVHVKAADGRQGWVAGEELVAHAE